MQIWHVQAGWPVQETGQLQKIGECMACQLNRLSLCKDQCRSNKNGSNSVVKSDRPSNKWGRAAAGLDENAEPTKLDSNRVESQLTRQQGDGPSESEILEAPEGEQDALRQYAKKYQKFRSEAEAVLDSERLSLGHRETVRQYFENYSPRKW